MTRPSRLERWSATTTLQTGSLRPPTRVNLSLTATFSLRSFEERSSNLADRVRRRLAGVASALLAHQRAQVRHASATDLAHQLADLRELLDHLVDGLDTGARAACDAEPPRALDQLRAAALLGCHRQDDRLEAVDLALVDLHPSHLRADPRQHPEQALHRPHTPHRVDLREEVLEVEVARLELLLELLGVVGVELALGLLDQRQHVAHAEDPLGHAVGVEALEGVESLPCGGEQDRLAGDRAHRQRLSLI